ncbi:hypothetical protein ABT167_27970 [Streptomyces sp. NPDC001792]|uniref:RHS repeat domain-containing protein n=1 Tax=Streptomyces sp. NPDC001792 TaxID=3154524 RepID=UPI00332118CF
MLRAQALVCGHGRIVAEFFDTGRSRTIPWARRPKAAALLAAPADPDRDCDALISGSSERAFQGNRFATMAPLLDVRLPTRSPGTRAVLVDRRRSPRSRRRPARGRPGLSPSRGRLSAVPLPTRRRPRLADRAQTACAPPLSNWTRPARRSPRDRTRALRYDRSSPPAHHPSPLRGRRTAKHRLADDSVTRLDENRFAWDGTRHAEEAHPSTGVTVTCEYDGHRPIAQGERKPLSDTEVDTRFFAIVTDLIGTPTELVTEDGEIACHTRTTTWGATAPDTDALADTPLRFPGQYVDPESGGLEPAPNPCAYVLNPATWLDLLGLATCKEYAKVLRGNMEANGVTFQPGQAAAHIVPFGGVKGH